MVDGMLDAFDRFIQHFTQHFICGHAQNVLKVDILLFDHHFQSVSTFCFQSHPFWILLEMLDVMLDGMLDAFDHPIVNIDEVKIFVEINVA